MRADPIVDETQLTKRWVGELLTLTKSASARMRVAGVCLLQVTAETAQFSALKSQISTILAALLALLKALRPLCVVDLLSPVLYDGYRYIAVLSWRRLTTKWRSRPLRPLHSS